MLLLLGAFIAGIVTVLAPCVLPLLPVIIGGSVSGDGHQRQRPLIIAASLAVSLILFTLLLKATTLLIRIPPQAITYVSGSIIILIGITSLFPSVYEKLIIKLGIQSRSQKLLGQGVKQGNGILGPIIIGAALGPVFSSCSPVYSYILATILPANFAQAMAYIVSYVLGLSLVLLLIGYLGQRFVGRIKWASNPKGWFQRIIAILFIIVGLLVFTGRDKAVQTWVSTHTPFDFDRITSQLIPAGKNQPSDGKIYNVEPYDAPEFAGLQNWINSDPLTKENLKGKVVLVDFWTYSCINCIRSHPYIQGWYDTYKDSDFVVVGVHAPEFAFEKIPANVQKATQEAHLTYPIALDNDFDTWNAFSNRYWPANYLIDAEGKVRRVHYGEGEYGETEQAIRGLLKEAGKKVPDKMFSEGKSDLTQSQQETPETYLGSKRAGSYVGNPRLLLGQTQLFTTDPSIAKDEWTLGGTWEVASDRIIARGASTITFKASAKEIYLVAGSTVTQSVGVKLNGMPISQTDNAGSDIRDSSVEVQESKLYRLVAHKAFTNEDTLELAVPEGVELNVFTFGS